MASIDERVVAMSFENAKFEAGVSQTLNTLSRLSTELARVGSTTGFDDISSAASRVNLGGLNQSVEETGNKFSVLAGAAAVALGNIATQAAMAGARFGKAFTFTPIMEGFHNYETQINAVQTILANTGLTGAQGLSQVNDVLSQLNVYANQTVYNFSEMARNIGTFTAAGVDLKTSAEAIKGIANLAALSGSNSQQASTAMYQLSQAIASGKVNLQDWNSVVNAGMGGKVFQKALWDTAKAMGHITNSPVGQTFDQWTKAGNTFRQSLSANAKTATSSASDTAKAQKDAAETIRNAEESAAASIQSANDQVKAAQKGVADAAKSTADAVSTATDRVQTAQQHVADVAKSSAQAIKDAQDQIKAAQQGVADAAKKSSEDIQAAVKAQREAVKTSAQDVQSALDGVTEARKRLAEAMKPPSTDQLQAAQDKLTTAQLDQADLAGAVSDAQREQKRTAEDLAAAQKKLAELTIAGADPSAILAATRAVEDAQHRATDAADAQERALIAQRDAARGVTAAQKDLTDVEQKGTNADANVKSSKDALTKALDQYKAAQVAARDTAIAAEQKVADARKAGADLQAAAAKQLVASETHLADIRRQNAQKEQDAAKSLVDAEKAVTKAREDGAYRQAQASQQLIDAQKNEVKVTRDAQDQIAKAHEQAATRIETAQAKSKPTKAVAPTWLTSDVLTNTLKQFTGDMSAAELKAQGFTDAQVKAIQAIGQTAVNAAVKIKTITQLTQALREEVGTAWANVFKTLFGDIGTATSLFSKLHVFMENALTNPINKFNKVLQEWAKQGGRVELLDALKKGFQDLEAVLKPIHDAFREIFPAKTAQDMLDATHRFHDLVEELKIGPKTAEDIKRTFAGFFAVLHIGKTIVGDMWHVIAQLLGVAGKGAGGILHFTGTIGDFLVALDKAISKGHALNGFFAGITAILRVPITVIEELANAFFGLFDGVDGNKAKGAESALSGIKDSLKPLKSVVEGVTGAWDKFVGIMGRVKDALTPMFGEISKTVGHFVNVVATGIQHADWNKVFAAVQTVLIGGIFVAIKKALGVGDKKMLSVDFGGKALKGLSDTLGVLTGNLKALQKNIQASTLLKIAAAIGILALGIGLLSQIDPKALSRAMGAVALGMGQLVAALWLMSKAVTGVGILTMPVLALSLMGIAAAVVILAGAVRIFSKLSWEELLKGLSGVGGALLAVGLGVKSIGPKVLIIGPGLLALALALNAIAIAVKVFSTLSWGELARGLLGVGGALVGIGLGLKTIGPSVILTGPALIAIATGLVILSGAVHSFSSMDLKALYRGILGVAGSLTAIGLAMRAIPKGIALQAIGLNILAVALIGISAAVKLMGSMRVETLVKGIVAIGGALVVMGFGLDAMSGTLAGSAALLAAAGALALLAPTLGFLGTLDWATIFKGLAAIALVLGTLALAGAVAAAPIGALGLAIAALGLGMLAIAGSVALLALAISSLSDTGVKAVAVLVASLTAFVAALPTIVINFLKGLADIIGAVAELAPKVAVSIGKILDTILGIIIEAAPKAALAIGALVMAVIKVLDDNAGPLVEAGARLLLHLLKGIADHIGDIVAQAARLVVNFLNALAQQAPAIVASGVNLVVNFIQGLANGAVRLVGAAANLVIKFLAGVASKLPAMVAAGANVLISWLKGIADSGPRVIAAAVTTIGKFLWSLSQQAPRLARQGAEAIINFINGIANAVRDGKIIQRLMDAAWNLAWAVIEGFVKGLGDLAWKVTKKAGEVILAPFKWVADKLGIGSPSKVWFYNGQMVVEGLVQGLGDRATRVKDAAENMIAPLMTAADGIPKVLEGLVDVQPTITPILDLSQVRKEAPKLQDLTNVTPITAAASYQAAAAISSEKSSADTAAAAALLAPTLKFEQNNYSPESLSDIEIYRQTRNQLSQVKSALGMT